MSDETNCEHGVKHCPVCGEQLRICGKCGHYKLCSFSFRVDHGRCRCPKVYDFSKPKLFRAPHEQKP